MEVGITHYLEQRHYPNFDFLLLLRLLVWLVPALAYGGEMDNEAFFHLVKAPFLKAFVCGMPKDTPVLENLPVSIEGPTDIPCYLTIIVVILKFGYLAPVRLGSLSRLIKIFVFFIY